MGNKKKFEKIERNDTYYETHGDEEIKQDEKKQKEKKIGKTEILPGIDSQNVPEKKTFSSRFTYKREKKKITQSEEATAQVKTAPNAPFVFSLVVLCIVLVMSYVVTSNIFLSLPGTTKAFARVIMYIAAYVVPSVIYLITPYSKKHFHNIRRFSVSTLPFAASCLGLMLCLAALQKYLIAYVFSYSEPLVSAQGNLLVSIVVGAFLPAICEELFVRGILQNEISEYAGGLCGVIVGALVFAMLHFELQYFFVYFLGGIILGSITHVTRSVFPAMAVHFLNNTLSILFSDKLSFIATERIGGTLLIIVLASVCFGFLILTLHLAEKISEKRAKNYLLSDKDESNGKNVESDNNVFFVISPDKKTPSKFLKVMLTPAMLTSIAIFIVVAFIKL
ncbi:MAG: CPBP family intramembrane metalloprotease [Clostridia bacterium]|nr:CPBP family intramembrane metalloprotease [Clostridia bacterium]